MDILKALRNTSKGQLQYDGFWYKDGALEEVLKECTSPPSISAPPKTRTTRATPDRSLPVTGLSLTEAEEQEYKKKINSFREEGQEEADKSISRCSPLNVKERKNSLNRSAHLSNSSPSDSLHDSNRSLGQQQPSPPRHADTPRTPEVNPREDDPSRSPCEELLVPTVTEVDHALRDYEDNVRLNVRRSLDRRRELFEQASARFGLEAESALTAVYVRQERQAQHVMAVALAEQRARSAEAQIYEQQCRERHKQHAQMLDTKLREAQARKKLQEEEEENQRRQEVIEQLETLSKIQQELKVMCTNSVKAITTCVAPQHLSENAKKASQILVQIIQRLDVLKQAHAAAPNAQHTQDALELTKKARKCAEVIEKGVEAANKQGKADAEAAAKAQAAAAAATAAAAAAASSTTTTTGLPVAVNPAVPGKAVSAKSDEVLCVDEQSFLRYQKLQENLKAMQDSFTPLTSDVNMKKYKFELQKAVNTPVNAIAPTSGAHLRDKLQRLCAVLQGTPVEVGGRRVSAADHAAGRNFVRDLFARKIIKQGEEQVAANHESAFAIAAVTVGVWCEVPEVGDLLLAHLHQRCPYAVPYYLPKKEGQSSDEYYKSLGYLYTDGAVEAQDKFLKRMSGMMRLYSSILVSSPPRGSTSHPHGVAHAWLWLANSLNLEPRPDITATMLYDVLAVTGHALFAAYRGQFVKLLQLLCTDYLPKVKAVTPAGSGGPVVRLENFLQKCISGNSVPRPDGLLTSNFWVT